MKKICEVIDKMSGHYYFLKLQFSYSTNVYFFLKSYVFQKKYFFLAICQLPTYRLIEKDQFDDDVRAVCCCTVVCVQGVQKWAEDAALRSTSVEDHRR